MMTISQDEFDRWREVVQLACQDAETAAQLIAGGEVQRGADRAHEAVATLRQLKARMDRVGVIAGDSSLGLEATEEMGSQGHLYASGQDLI